MNRNVKSLLGGAALAAFVVAPSLPGLCWISQAAAAPAPSPGGNRFTAPIRYFNTSNIELDDIVGKLIVEVRDGGPMSVELSGDKSRVNRIRLSQNGGRLTLEGVSDVESDYSVWDWRHWFDFPHGEDLNKGDLTVKVTVPRGSGVNVKDLVGDAAIGDTMGALRFEAAATKAHIGKVAKASIEVGGSGQIDIAGVAGDLDLSLGGSGKINVRSAGNVKADIAGSAEADFGQIAGGLRLDITGSGDVTAARVNGPTRIGIAGSGSVRIADGIADPLRVTVMGAGNLYFGGVAVDPRIDAVGSATVRIKAYRGHLDSEGMADVKIGD